MLTPAEIYTELNRLSAAGDENGARDFLLQRSAEFPEDIRDEILFQLSSEDLIEEAAFAAVKVKVLQMLEALEKEKKAEEILRDQAAN